MTDASPGLEPPRARVRAFELAIVTLVAALLLLPGLWRYSLVDPWETHYGDVGRKMLADHDWVHTDWQNEGFRSKPVLTFWLMAASLRANGLAADGGYSGEMTDSTRILWAMRLPFAALGVMGLVMTWWMLARLLNRRTAWLSLLVIGTSPMYFMISRQAITDITMVAPLMGAFACFMLAAEDGDEPIRRFWRVLDSRWVFAALIGGFTMVQAVYYFVYFQLQRWRTYPVLAITQPGWWFLGLMSLGMLYVLAPRAFTYARMSLVRWFVPPARARELAETSVFAYPLALVFMPWVALVTTEPVIAGAMARARRVARVDPLTRTSQVYMLWFWSMVGLTVLGKGLPGFGIAGVACALYVVIAGKWRDLGAGRFEIKRGVVLLALVILPWHIAMWLRDGPKFIQDWVYTHNLNRAAVGVDSERGTFDYVLGQLGYGMFLWAAMVPMALAACALVPAASRRAARVRLMAGIWALTGTALFCLSQTKFHHYIFPALPAFGVLIAIWLDDLLAGRAKPSLAIAALGAGVVLLLARDLMWAERIWIDMYIFGYGRPWPSTDPWRIDTSDAFLWLGLACALAIVLLGTRLRRVAVVTVSVGALAAALWAMHVYMPIAGTHWGMREAVRRYYQDRQIYGAKLIYDNPRSFHDDWAGVRDHWDVETMIPDAFQDGQPMTVSIEVRGLSNELHYLLHGTGRVAGGHTIRITLDRGELAPAVASAKKYGTGRRGRPPMRFVDADRLIAWQLYWRGENFWSGDEIWGPLPEQRVAFNNYNKEADAAQFAKYLADHTLAPEGRRYFVVTIASAATSVRGQLPTETARQTFEVLDTTSNKFSLVAFQM